MSGGPDVIRSVYSFLFTLYTALSLDAMSGCISFPLPPECHAPNAHGSQQANPRDADCLPNGRFIRSG